MRLSTSRHLTWVPLLIAAFCLTTAASAQSRQASLTAQTSASRVRASLAPAARGGIQLLYNQVQGTATSGIVSQNNATATQFNNIAGDDFTVTTGQTWQVSQVFARGFYTTAGQPGVCASGDVSFWTNNVDEPGTVIETRSGAPSSDVTGALTFDFASVSLTEGTYWVTVVCNGPTLDLGVSGRWNWFYNSVQHMQPGQLRNDNGGFGVPAGWNAINDLGAGIGPDFDFSISGTSSGTAVLPELVLNPEALSGTVAAGGTTSVALQIMNTGTADLTFAFPAFAAQRRIESLAALGINLQPLFRAASADMPKGVEGFNVPGGTGAQYRVGGPDAYGYTFIDSDEEGGPVFDPVNIANTGTVQTLAAYGTCTAGDAQDEGRVAVTLPFTFSFYGQDVTELQVYANGVIGMDPALATCVFTNSASVPNVAAPNGGLIAPFWDDLDLGDTGRILTEQLADGRFVIQWDAAPRFGGAETAFPNTFQAILSEDGTVTFQYLSITTATLNSQTVGIESQTGTVGLAANINTAGYTVDGLAVSFISPTLFISDVAPSNGTVETGGMTTVTVTLDATDLTEGVYSQDLLITTNDADEASVLIPVTLTVTGGGGGGDIEVTPSPVVETLASGDTGTESVTLTNNTDEDVTYSFPQYAGAPARAATPRRVHPAMELGKGQADPRSGTQSAFMGEGGPDAFGYQWIDSNEPGGPTYAFEDISDSGASVTLEATPGCTFEPGDEGRALVTLPSAFSFYGETYTQMYVYANGVATFDLTTENCQFTNGAIPTDDANGFNGLLAPFWDDLDLRTSGGSIKTQAMPNGDFVIQWTDMGRFASAVPTYTFQVILSATGAVRYQYDAMTGDVAQATVGIESPDGTDGLQIAFNEAYAESGLAVLIQARPGFLTDITAASGTIPANGSVTVDFAFDAAGLLGGQYTGEVDLVTSVDTLSVPVVLNVTGTPTVTVSPDPLQFGGVIAGATSDLDVTISNNGSSDLVVSAVTSDNAAYSADFTGPLTIAPGGSASVTVTFAPTTVGQENGTLSVVSNASSSPDTVRLRGRGLAAPNFSVSPAALAFTVQQTRVSDPQALTLSNTGAGRGTYSTSTSIVTPAAPASPARHPASAEDAAKTLTGLMPATPGTQYLGGEVVADGSFEAGTPNPFWEEVSSTFGTPLCDVAGCGTGGGTGPRTGDWWTWFGGAAAGDVGSMEQTVTIPGGSAMLNFYLEIPLVAGGTGFVAVTMDGDEVFRATYDQDQATYATYALVSIDASDYADGGDHVLRFESTTTGSGNFFIDDVSIEVEAGLLLTVRPASGAVDANDTRELSVVADASNADIGVYQAEIRIATNDPAHPVLIVPVTVTVTAFVANEGDGAIPTEVTLLPSYPNPASSTTTLKFGLPAPAMVRVHVYDVAGRLVRTVVEAERAAGFHEVPMDASSLASGLYFVRMQVGAEVRTVRLSVVR